MRYTNTVGSADYTTGAGNLMLSDGIYNDTYDDENQRTSRTRIADGQVTAYTWDLRHRLTRVDVTTPVPGSTSGATTTQWVEYGYDVFHRLVSRSAGGSNLPVSHEGRFYDGDTLLAEYNADTDHLTQGYISGQQIDQVFAQLNFGTAGEVYALTDLQGSVRATQAIDGGEMGYNQPFASAPEFAE